MSRPSTRRRSTRPSARSGKGQPCDGLLAHHRQQQMRQALGQERFPDGLVIAEGADQKAVARAGLGVHSVERREVGRTAGPHAHPFRSASRMLYRHFGFIPASSASSSGARSLTTVLRYWICSAENDPPPTLQQGNQRVAFGRVGSDVRVDLDEQRRAPGGPPAPGRAARARSAFLVRPVEQGALRHIRDGERQPGVEAPHEQPRARPGRKAVARSRERASLRPRSAALRASPSAPSSRPRPSSAGCAARAWTGRFDPRPWGRLSPRRVIVPSLIPPPATS